MSVCIRNELSFACGIHTFKMLEFGDNFIHGGIFCYAAADCYHQPFSQELSAKMEIVKKDRQKVARRRHTN